MVAARGDSWIMGRSPIPPVPAHGRRANRGPPWPRTNRFSLHGSSPGRTSTSPATSPKRSSGDCPPASGRCAATVADARRAIDESPRLARVALTTLLIGVTHFFRDAHVFDHLAERVLPRLAARCRRLRVWSVGCSDGPELYSLAMLLADLGLLDRCDLLGTDCRPDAVERARQGFYDDAAVRGIPAALRDRHMNCEGGHWRVGQRLRDAAQWRTTDILALREPGLWDLVLCRNLAIYLQPPAAAGLWRRLEAAVRPGGVLALGKAERPDCARQFIELGPCLYHRTSNTDVA